MYAPAVVITLLMVMGMGGRRGLTVTEVEEEEVELETSGLVRQKMLVMKACILFVGWCGQARKRSVRLLRCVCVSG
jgi:hypothetical protein